MPTKSKTATAVMEEEELMEEEGVEEAEEGPSLLTGAELLAFYDEQSAAGLSHKEIAYKAGYYSVTAKGIERVNSTQFADALLEAKGFAVSKPRKGGGRGHAGFRQARVSGQGVLLVSQLAVRHVGGEPGAVYAVSYPGDGSIVLTPTGEVIPVARRKKEG